MMRVVAAGSALIVSGALLVGCQGGSSKGGPFGLGATDSPTASASRDGITEPPPPPSPDPATPEPPVTSAPPRPTATERADVPLTTAQAKTLVATVALVPKDWGPTYVPQERNYEYGALDRVITGTDCKQVVQGTVPGALATMARYVYIPDGQPSVDNLSKTLATSSATVYADTAAAQTDMRIGIADGRRCPNQVLAGDEKLNGIQVFDLTVPGIDEVHVARAQWFGRGGGPPFQYVWVTARQGQMVLTAAVVDRGDKTFESAKNQAIDALAKMVARTRVQLR
ncbi:hypothetical protein [Embleya scabrispora]|uniref:hypothetical protein n=1 Tax=Embleya scabrispora TaxID=159449 RepID=UPI00035CC322|nr:hypothetical protein [Embleya scabrispora]MYS83293.1 hypothetical protein [Streptomyces sp. SID5474]